MSYFLSGLKNPNSIFIGEEINESESQYISTS